MGKSPHDGAYHPPFPDIELSEFGAGAAPRHKYVIQMSFMLNAEAALEPTRFARFAAAVSLYKALGGGWSQEAPLAAAQSRR